MKVALIDADSLFYKVSLGKFNQFSNITKNGWDLREYWNHIDSWVEHILKKTNSTHYLCFHTKGKVFRHDISKNYKADRPDKPVMYYPVYNHFINKWNSIQVNGLEAEDCVSIYAKYYRSKNIDYTVAYIDHDLLQIEGKLFNYSTDELFEITIDRANYNLFRQVCTGCTTDKVQGLKGVGDKTADKYFESQCWLTDKSDLYGDLHLKSLSLYIEKEGLKQGISHFSECFNLVYLLTTPEEVKSITGQDFEFKEPYYFSNVNPNIFGNFTKSEDDSDLPDFLK